MSTTTSHLPTWARAKKSTDIQAYQELTADGAFSLNVYEEWWRDRYYILEKHGYRLRPRYRPDWTPSWIGTDAIPRFCEDSYSQQKRPIIDAVRIVDGTTVVVKQVPKGSEEVRIGKYLSEPELREDTDNHCVPILDDFHDEAEPEKDFIVMPLLRAFDDPPFSTVREIIDFMKQVLQGLIFLHDHDVAHRDCSNGNIMMDASSIYPDGFHPTRHDRLPSGLSEAKPLRRTDVSSVKYYFVDFGLASRFTSKDQPRLVFGRDGLDQEVPEINGRIVKRYDPFPVDVFILGNLFKKTFVNVYHNMSFIKPLADAMTQTDPKARPTAKAALEEFHSIIAHCSEFTLRRRLRRKSEFVLASLYRDVDYYIREAVHFAKSFSFKLPI